jgi:hypothetical protein
MTKGTGFDTSSLVSFGTDPVRNGYSPAEVSRLIRRIHDEIRALRSTQTSAVARFQLSTGGSWHNPMTIEAGERIVTDRIVNLNAITPGFFSTLGTSIVAGRDFEQRDSLPREVRPACGDRQRGLCKTMFLERSPLGARIFQGFGSDAKPDIEIIGIVADISYRGIRDESEQAYFPISKEDFDNFYVRVQGRPKHPLSQFVRFFATSMWLVLRDALIMITSGIVIALSCVWAVGHLLESQLSEVKSTDPLPV